MKKLSILLVLIVVFVVGFVVWWKNGEAPVNPQDKTPQTFVIEPGAPIRGIGRKLQEQGLIKNSVVFFLHVKKNGLDKKIQAGDYKLNPSMSLQQVMKQLTTGRLDVWVTIPEGKRAEEIAQIFSENLPSYDKSWDEVLIPQEGYLYPETYLIPAQADVQTVIAILNNTLNQKAQEAGVDPNSASFKNTLILASIIEREAKTDEEKPIIAGILTNRLNEGMALQVDATVQYAKGFDGKRWWPVITVDDYKGVASPYNTYLNPGLPPAPISNPGIESIKAAANPANTPYVYYLHGEDGKIHYARTVSEHNNNINRYLR